MSAKKNKKNEEVEELLAPSTKTMSAEDFIDESVKNIRTDRAYAAALLQEVFSLIHSANDKYNSHEKLGVVATKYLETLQRSNEQFVKLAVLKNKETDKPASLTQEDKENLMDILNASPSSSDDRS